MGCHRQSLPSFLGPPWFDRSEYLDANGSMVATEAQLRKTRDGCGLSVVLRAMPAGDSRGSAGAGASAW